MIGYLGPQGTFSQLAALEHFGENTPLKAYGSIYSLILATERGEVEKAIVPIENSIEGSVNMTLDTLAFDVNLYITDEYILKVSENLMVKEGTKIEDITKVLSHPQPIAQCAHMLESRLSGIPTEYTESTAAAAKIVSESDEPFAVLGPKSLADMYGLEILLADCEDDHSNSTRFVVIERSPTQVVTNSDKTSVAFTLDNRPGSLWTALEMFADQKINMIKIESRPVKKELGKYIFFIDIDGNIDDATIFFALNKIRSHTEFYKFLGSYRKAQTEAEK
ncbi:MAG: prephenate dehydratase [Clostridia bacterium]|nr:prephenate dehydratase [Clostridia bacterium]